MDRLPNLEISPVFSNIFVSRRASASRRLVRSIAAILHCSAQCWYPRIRSSWSRFCSANCCSKTYCGLLSSSPRSEPAKLFFRDLDVLLGARDVSLEDLEVFFEERDVLLLPLLIPFLAVFLLGDLGVLALARNALLDLEVER